MSTPFAIQGILSLPLGPGSTAEPIPFGVVSQFDSRSSFEYLLPASSGTQVVDFGTMPAAGAKLVLVSYEAVGTPPPPPITLTVNGGSSVELSAGGFLCVGSPSPVSGVTSLDIGYTDVGKVKIWLLG